MIVYGAEFELSVGECRQFPPSTMPEIVVSGHSNVGKSSLINTLLQRRSLARTSSTPGKTATVNFYRLDAFRLVDLPGYGYAKVSKSERAQFSELIGGYFASERDCRLVIQLLDMRHTPTEADRKMIDFLVDAAVPFVVALTKADKLTAGERARRGAAFGEEFAALEGLAVVPFSAITGEGASTMIEWIDEVTVPSRDEKQEGE